MNPETVEDIYNAFSAKKLNTSDLLFFLSRYDMCNEMPRDTFRKRNRVHRTIITEIKRYIEQKGSYDDEPWLQLRELYIKEYLYFCAAKNIESQTLDFTRYVQTLIDTHKVIKRQYRNIREKELFWKAITLIEKDMQNT